MGNKQRLDHYLVERGFFLSRSRARDAVQRGTVSLAGRVVLKPAFTVEAGADIVVNDPAQAYVSRAALKLIAALDVFNIVVKGRSAVDLGASTGGFTQVLLERGVRHVVAVDVGYGQLDAMLKNDARVTLHEGLNARYMKGEHLDGRAINLVVSDMSFISLKLALPAMLALAQRGSYAVILVKPQFEAGRQAIGKGGIVRDQTLSQKVAEDVARWFDHLENWSLRGLLPSPIAGSDGNQEYLLFGEKNA